jgi:branched-chain amino acid transport system permease protein
MLPRGPSFLVALGLTLIFRGDGHVNVAHGALYAFGGYTAASLIRAILSLGDVSNLVLLVALFIAAIVVGVVLGSILEIGLLRQVQDKDPVLQLLITFGFPDPRRCATADLGRFSYTANEVAGRLGTLNCSE